MKLLITHSRLDQRGGVAPFVRNWAHVLGEMGHTVLCFSANPTLEFRALAADGVPVTTDIDELPFVPDVIHAQANLETMAALAALPDVPALYHCHGGTWAECPPVHPRIYEYLAVSHTLLERMAVEFNIPLADARVHLNSINLSRYSVVRRLPAQPSRALFFNHRHALDSDTVRAVQYAAASCGVTLDVVGNRPERRISKPEVVLPTYDVVFASGTSAMEAMASGCAVVIIGQTTCGEMVQPENYERFRRVNFTIAGNSPPRDHDWIAGQLRAYSPEGSAWVSDRLRHDADCRTAIPQLVPIYERVIERHKGATVDPRADLVATSRFLQWVAPVVGMTDSLMNGRWDAARGARTQSEASEALARIRSELDASAAARTDAPTVGRKLEKLP